MRQFEYKHGWVKDENFHTDLKSYGLNGWEVVNWQQYPQDIRQNYVLFKREMNQKSEPVDDEYKDDYAH